MEEAAPSSLSLSQTHAHRHVALNVEADSPAHLGGIHLAGCRLRKATQVSCLRLWDPALDPQQSLRSHCMTVHLDSHPDPTIAVIPKPSESSNTPSTTMGLVGSIPWVLSLNLPAVIAASYLETLAGQSFEEIEVF